MLDNSFLKIKHVNNSRINYVLFWVLILIPPSFILILVNKYGVDFPYWDQWKFVPLLIKAHYGELTFSDLWAQHLEHRILFPRIIMLLLAYITNWNIMYELYLSVILAGLILWFLYLLLRLTVGNYIPSWLPIVMSFLTFSTIQYENWMWGWQIQIFLNVLCIVIAILSVSRFPGNLKGIAIAIVFSFIASFSFNNGLLIWIIIAILLFFQNGKKIAIMHYGWQLP